MGISPNNSLYKALKEVEVRIVLVLGQKPEIEVPESGLFMEEGDANLLLVVGAGIAWFANKRGEVIFVNRADLYGLDKKPLLWLSI